MQNTSSLASTQYQALVATHSERAPMWGLASRHITLLGSELAIVMRAKGGADFVSDALTERLSDRNDPLALIAQAACLPDYKVAADGVGVIVQLALMQYAAKVVREDILELREREHVYDRYDHRGQSVGA